VSSLNSENKFSRSFFIDEKMLCSLFILVISVAALFVQCKKGKKGPKGKGAPKPAPKDDKKGGDSSSAAGWFIKSDYL
jgi:hypothetical protein